MSTEDRERPSIPWVGWMDGWWGNGAEQSERDRDGGRDSR